MSDARSSSSPRPAEGASSRRGLSRDRRLRRRDEFSSARRHGSAARCAFATVIVRARGAVPGASGESEDVGSPARLGIVASRKVGNAVLRNRAKRRIREWFRHADARAHFDVVVIAAESLADAPPRELAAALDDALGRAVARALHKGATSAPHKGAASRSTPRGPRG